MLVENTENISKFVAKICTPFDVRVMNDPRNMGLDITAFKAFPIEFMEYKEIGMQELFEKISDEFQESIKQTVPYMNLKADHEFDLSQLRNDIERLEADLIVKNNELEEMTRYKTFYDLYKGLKNDN